ncbi:MAG TPA: hypothetical protein VFN45_14005 [Myxococcaceae bacterium]|nr:hypothetical protein [Myxococcaceae bacterium]
MAAGLSAARRVWRWRSAGTPTGSLDAEGFRALMERLAAGWREEFSAAARV